MTKKQSTPEKIPIISIETLIEQIKKTDLTSLPDVHKLTKPLEKSLWALNLLDEKFPILAYSPADVIAEILTEGVGVKMTALSVTKTLAKAGDKVNSKENGKETVYKIMKTGKDHLNDISGEGKTPIYKIGGQTPYSDKQYLVDVVEKSSGEIKIVDPYYGTNSLKMLGKLDFGRPVKLLTGRLSGVSQTTFSQELQDFKTEHTSIEIAVYPNTSELHDRYIITNDSVIFLGHGIKDLGGKESFILIFEKQIGQDIILDLSTNFDQKWLNSTIL